MRSTSSSSASSRRRCRPFSASGGAAATSTHGRRNSCETLLLPIAGLEPLQQPGVYLAVMRAAGSYGYSQPATLFSLSDIGLSAHRYRNRLDVFTQALAGGAALAEVELQ